MRIPLGALSLLVGLGCGSPNSGTNADALASSDASGDATGEAGPGDGAVDGSPPVIEVLQGADRASAFSAAEAHSLETNDGVRWTGVYIGGACSAGSGWTKSLLTTLATDDDWTFMPIWVGQQAPTICGHSALTAAQGKADGEATATMMATYDWAPNLDIPVVLDLEAGSYTYSESGAKAYAGAWRDAVRSAGYLAYLYSNPTAINALYDAGIVFDGAWPASWFYTSFHTTAPDDLTQLGTRYTAHDRAWQYAGDFAVSGAGTVDGDASDLLLAPAPGGTNK